MGLTGIAVWIGLGRLLNRRRLVGVMRRYPCPEAAWSADERQLAEAALAEELAVPADLTEPEELARWQRWADARRDRLARSLAARRQKAETAAQATMQRMANCGARAIAYCDPDFPPILKHIPDPPALLYCLGPLIPGDGRAVALVGTRKPTGYGLSAAESLSRAVAQAGITVVSGMAKGIDCAAHRGALAAGGRTIAVLGSGVDVPCPPQARAVYRRIVETGLVISEHPPGTPGYPEHFPERNRLIAGLSQLVVVVEATHTSGTRHTVNAAHDQGCDVVAVPGPIDSPLSEYPNALLRDGARAVCSPADILHLVGCFAPPPVAMNGTPDEAALMAQLHKGPRSVDELAIGAGLLPGRVAAALTTLEIRGVVRLLPNGRYCIE